MYEEDENDLFAVLKAGLSRFFVLASLMIAYRQATQEHSGSRKSTIFVFNRRSYHTIEWITTKRKT